MKLSALAFDPALFDELAAGAVASGRILHVDALALTPPTRRGRCSRRPPRAATSARPFPGRWARSVDDAARMAGLGVHIRVVKGQWADDAPGGGPEPADGFARVVERLRGAPGASGSPRATPPC